MRIHELDLHYRGVLGAIAAWAIEGPGGWVLIESGPELSWPQLSSGLDAIGVQPSELSALLVTHIHLDHSGGAWRLAELGVPIHVHELGVQHLVDPSKLLASARRIYGDQMESLWGRIKPCPDAIVHATAGGDVVHVAGMEFTAVETTGHAKHHLAWSLEGSDSATLFTGDVAAMLIPGTDWISIPMPPPELDLKAWQESIDRIDGGTWTRLCLTHGGTVEEEAIPGHLDRLRRGLQDQVEYIENLQGSSMDAAQQQAAYRDWLLESALEAGIEEGQFDQFVTPGLLSMNLHGVARFLQQGA